MNLKAILAGLFCALFAWLSPTDALARNCVKGVPCGNSCIAAWKTCHVDSYSPSAVRTTRKTTTRKATTTHLTEVYPAREDGDSYETLTRDTAVDIEIPQREVAPQVAKIPIELENRAAVEALKERVKLVEHKYREPGPTDTTTTVQITQSTPKKTEEVPFAASVVEPTIPAKSIVAKPTPAYYTVPTEKSGSVVKRIQLVEYILRHYGRAYDYRTMTSRQLEDVVAELRREERSAPPRALLAE